MMETAVTGPAVTRDDIDAAARRIAGYVRVTPVLELARGELGGDFVPLLKLEFLQHSGTFKARGAFNNLLSRPVGPAGVTAVSGGNHGAGVAFAAARLGHRARIYVPASAPPAKVALIRRLGADAVVGGTDITQIFGACDAYAAETGALQVHPFGTPETIAGQGTMAREWQQQSALDTVLIAVGGGGLISGAAAWLTGQGVRLVGVEPEGARALHAALAAGAPVDVVNTSIASDSLGAPHVAPLAFALCARGVDHVALVTDADIVLAQQTLWRDFRIATEPGGATAFAALQSGAYRPGPGERVGILMCGSNVDLLKLREIAG